MTAASKITTGTISKIAALARIKLTADEAAAFSSQLSPVLEHIDNLNRLNTAAIPPTFQVTNLKNILRDDAVIPGLTAKQATASAAKISGTYIVMPKTIDK